MMKSIAVRQSTQPGTPEYHQNKTQPSTPQNNNIQKPKPTQNQTPNAKHQGPAPERTQAPSHPTQSMWSYPLYGMAQDFSQFWGERVVSPFSDFAHSMMDNRLIAGSQRADFMTGMLSSPATVAMTIGMAVPGGERLVRTTIDNPRAGAAMLTGAAPAGLMMMGGGMYESAKANPNRFAGEMVGMAMLGRAGGMVLERSPVGISVGKFNSVNQRFVSVGVSRTVGASDRFTPIVGLSRGPGFLNVRPTIGTPRVTIADTITGRYSPKTPYESAMFSKALSRTDSKRVGLATDVKGITSKSTLGPKEMKPILKNVVESHKIPNADHATNVIVTTLKEHHAVQVGSVMQKAVGRDTGQVGLSRTPHDIDVHVPDPKAFSETVVNRVNTAAGRRVLKIKDEQTVVDLTGDTMFDVKPLRAEIHGYDDASPLDAINPQRAEYIAWGLKFERPVTTKEGLQSITLSEQSSRKLEGGMAVFPESSEVGGLSGQVLPKHEGRVKDIGDFYLAEKIHINLMEQSHNPVKRMQGSVADVKLEAWLDSWSPEVAGNVRADYLVSDPVLKTTIADYSPRSSPSPSPYSSVMPGMKLSSPSLSPSPFNSKSPSPSFSPSPSPSLMTSPSSVPSFSPPSPSLSPSPSPSPNMPPYTPPYNPSTQPPYEPPYHPPPPPPNIPPPHVPPLIPPPIIPLTLNPPKEPPTITTVTSESEYYKFETSSKTKGIQYEPHVKPMKWKIDNLVPSIESVMEKGINVKFKEPKLPKF